MALICDMANCESTRELHRLEHPTTGDRVEVCPNHLDLFPNAGAAQPVYGD